MNGYSIEKFGVEAKGRITGGNVPHPVFQTCIFCSCNEQERLHFCTTPRSNIVYNLGEDADISVIDHVRICVVRKK
jgi:hypothetical protein